MLSAAVEQDPSIHVAVSATTRAPRPGEQDGVHYHFLGREDFEARIAAGKFVEWAEVHGNYYGTLLSEVRDALDAGRDMVLEIDVQGMRQIKETGLDLVTVFIQPPSLEVLEERLRGRGADSDAVIAVRLRNAREEMAARGEFEYLIVNGELSEAIADFEAIVRATRRRTVRMLQKEFTDANPVPRGLQGQD